MVSTKQFPLTRKDAEDREHPGATLTEFLVLTIFPQDGTVNGQVQCEA